MEEEPPPGGHDGLLTDPYEDNAHSNAVPAPGTGSDTTSSPEETNPNATPPTTPNKTRESDDTAVSSPNARKLRGLYEERFNAMKKACEQERLEYDKAISEKDATIKELNTRLENTKLNVVKMCNDEVFIPKLRKGVTGPTKSCETSGCDRIDVDLIKGGGI